MSPKVPIGERLRQERERLGLNQTEMGELAGVSRKTQFNYESGERYPDAQYLALVEAAGVDVLFVITGHHTQARPVAEASHIKPAGPLTTDGNSLALSVDEAALIDNYRHSNEMGRRVIEAAAAAAATPDAGESKAA